MNGRGTIEARAKDLLLRTVRVVVAEDARTRPTPDERLILDIPELTIPAGALVCVTGPSGSGKSTLLNLIAGLTPAQDGEILWGDTALHNADESRRDTWRRTTLGMVFQDFYVFGHLSALDNVVLPLGFGGHDLSRRVRLTKTANKLLTELGIRQVHAPVGKMSRGEQQRVAIARAFLQDPPLLLADEPTASLDASTEALIFDLLLAGAQARGSTLVLATHDPMVRKRCSHVLELEHGRIRAWGTV